jgi:hypothetical protein
MIPLFLIKLVGERAAKPVFFAFIVAFIAVVSFTLAKCTGGDDTAELQAEQTTRSGDAIANAAENAVEVVTKSAATDQTIDRSTAVAQKEIDNAQTPLAVRNAVLDGVCKQKSHRNDPACALR